MRRLHWLVAFVTSLEFMTEPPVAVWEAARVARHGLLFGVLSPISPLGLWRKLRGLFGPSAYQQAHLYTPRTLAPWFVYLCRANRAGLRGK